MIILDYPMNLKNFRKNYLAFRNVWYKEKNDKDGIMNKDLLRFYQAKANIFAKEFEDSAKKDYRLLMKAVDAMEEYDDLDPKSSFSKSQFS